jgi:hypothetical protein
MRVDYSEMPRHRYTTYEWEVEDTLGNIYSFGENEEGAREMVQRRHILRRRRVVRYAWQEMPNPTDRPRLTSHATTDATPPTSSPHPVLPSP